MKLLEVCSIIKTLNNDKAPYKKSVQEHKILIKCGFVKLNRKKESQRYWIIETKSAQKRNKFVRRLS